MRKYINANDYKELIEREKAECYPLDDEFEDGCRTGLGIAVEVIDEMPAADVIEAKYGYWKRLNNDPVNHPMDLLCSECRYMSYKRTDFCPHCGADMRIETELERRRKHILNTVDKRLGEIREVLSGGRKPNDNK